MVPANNAGSLWISGICCCSGFGAMFVQLLQTMQHLFLFLDGLNTMARADSLFRLVKSLSKSEKRYFKLFASTQGKDKKYMLLFNAIDKQDEYDEEKLKEHFREERFVRQFSVAKNYLYSLVMKSLRLYHANSSVAWQVYELLQDTEILSQRGLAEEAGKVAEKAVRLAQQHDKFPLHIEALEWRNAVLENAGTTEQRATERSDVLAKLQNMSSYRLLMEKASRPVRQSGIRNAKDVAEIQALMQDPLLQSEDAALSYRALLYYHWIYATCYFAIGQYEDSLRSVQRMTELMEERPDVLPEFISTYLYSLSNAIVLYKRLYDRKGFEHIVEKLRTRGKQTLSLAVGKRNSTEAQVFTAINLHLLALHNNVGQYAEAKELMNDVEKGMKEYDRYISNESRMFFLNNLTLLSFGMGDYRKALGYNNQMITGPEPWTKKQLYYSAKLINIVLHYELGHTSLLKGLVASTRRYLESRNHLFALETTFLDFFEKLLRLRSPQAKMQAFETVRDRFLELQEDPLEHEPFRSFGYLAWAESKVRGCSYADVVREDVKLD